MRTHKLFLCSILLLVLSSNMWAQCPNGKTALIWVNGILVKDKPTWDAQVSRIKTAFIATHSNLSSCITFVPVYNVSHGYIDLLESSSLLKLQDELAKYAQGSLSATELADLVKHFVNENSKGITSVNPDLLAVYDEVANQWNAGYQQVILVGHSEGSELTNQTYTTKYLDDRIIPSPKLPNPNILSVVNIATPAQIVADGRLKYTTQCNDAIQFVKFFAATPLPYNLPDNSGVPCIAPELVVGTLPLILIAPPLLVVDAVAVAHDMNVHDLEKSYMSAGSASRKQIYAQLEDSLPDPGCGNRTNAINCYLNDSFGGTDYTNNWQQCGDSTLAVGSTIQEYSGTLRLTSYNNYTPILTGPGIAPAPARLKLRSRRVFTGPFATSLQYNWYGAGSTTMVLTNAATGNTAAFWSLGPVAVNSDWHTLIFTKTTSQITVVVDGKPYTGFPLTPTTNDGYYLYFDLQGNNTLQVKDFSAVRGTIEASPTMTLTPATSSITVAQGTSGSVDFTLNSQNGMTGKPDLELYCTPTCPTNFTYQFPQGTSTNLPANGSIPIYITFNTNASTTLGTYNYQYWATLNSKTVLVGISVTVTTPPPSAPTIALTPATNNVSIVQGNSGFVDFTITSTNGATGTVTIQPHCLGVSVCPAGFTYNYSTSATLPANGTLSLRMTFNTITTVAVGTYNYDYQVTLNGKTVVSSIMVIVTAPVVTIGTVVISTTGNVSTACILNGAGVTAPITVTNQAVGTKSLSCTAPSGYTLNSVSPGSQNLTAGGTASFVVTLTKIPVTTGTISISTTGNIVTACVLNGSSITAPTTQTGKAAGTYTLACTAPTGYNITVSPATQTLAAGGTASFAITLTLIPLPPLSASCAFAKNPGTVGQLDVVSILQSGGIAPINFVANGVNLGTGNILNITPVSIGSATVQFTVTDAKGRQAFGSCSVPVVAPQPLLSYLTVNTNPKVGLLINVSLFGSGFIQGSQAYVCSSPSGSCSATSTVFVSAGQLSLPSVQWSTPATIYLKVINPGGVSSGFLSMVVIK